MDPNGNGVPKDRAGELDEDLQLLARKLGSLAEAPMLSKEAEDRIYMKVEAALDAEMALVAQTAFGRMKSGISTLEAFLPRPAIQRKADALAAMIDKALAGEAISPPRELAGMMAIAGALQPLPAISPNPSFVDWLEVRLTSPRTEAEGQKTGRLAALNGILSRGRFQAGLAGAAAAIVALAALSLQGSDSTLRAPNSPNVTAAPHVPVAEVPSVVETPDQVASVPASGSVTSKLDSSRPGGGNGGGDNGGRGNGAGKPNPPPDDDAFTSAGSEVNTIADAAMDAVQQNTPL